MTPNSRSWCANRTALHPDDHLYMPIRGSDFFGTSALLVLAPLFFDGLCSQLSLGPLSSLALSGPLSSLTLSLFSLAFLFLGPLVAALFGRDNRIRTCDPLLPKQVR